MVFIFRVRDIGNDQERIHKKFINNSNALSSIRIILLEKETPKYGNIVA